MEEGETVAIVGESGCGKSVSALSILRLIANPPGEITGGKINFMGQDLLQLSDREIREIRGRDISMIFQEPMTSLNPVLTIGVQLTEAMEFHLGIDTEEAENRAVKWLEMVGISEPRRRLKQYPHHFSGGMRQRVMIAMALCCEPKLIIADEPTTALDVTVQAQVLKLMGDIQKRLSMSMLFITHDLGVVRSMADRVCVMNDGLIVEQGPTEKILKRPEHDYTKHLLAAEPKGEIGPAPADAPSVIKGNDVKVWFPIKRGVLRQIVGPVKAVDGISIDVKQGQTLGGVGESGSGKTTLLKAISAQLEPDSGTVHYRDRRNDSIDIYEISRNDMRANQAVAQLNHELLSLIHI